MSHQVDVQNMMAQAQSVDARHSMFSEVHGQQINGDHTIINHYNKDTAEVQQELADWLTPLNFRQKQNDIYGNRQEGTGDWVLKDERFKEWERGDVKTLWCPGIPGAGKTVLASHIINHLANTHKSPSIGVAYIYCEYKDQSSQTILDLVSSLLKQLVQDSSPTFERVKSRYQSHRQQKFRPTLKEVHDTLIFEIKTFSRVFVVVDALDEIAEERKKRYELLDRLQSLGCNLLVTSRDIGSIGKDLRDAQCMHIRANDDDIRQYIESGILGTSLEGFVAEEPSLRKEIVDCVTKYADGMFLLCRLHVGSLETMITCREVREALKNLSKDMNNAYDETMVRINKRDKKHRELALTAIMCITYALRPLSDKELQHTVTLLRGSLGITSNDLVDITSILGACAGLVVVDAERAVARLIHYTAQEYFSGYKEWLCSNPHAELTNLCLKVLSIPPPADPYQKWPFSGEFSHYAVENWGNHARGLVEETNKAIIHNFLHHEQNVKRLGDVDVTWTGGSHSSVMHLCAFWSLTRTIEYQLQSGAVVGQQDDLTGRTALHIAVIREHVDVVSLLCDRGYDVNSQDAQDRTPLSFAAGAGNAESVKWFFEDDDVEDESRTKEGQVPFTFAAENGNAGTSKPLLARDDVKADSKGEDDLTRLSFVAIPGSVEILKWLLKGNHMESVSIELGRKNGQMPSFAAEYGNAEIVKLLLARDDVKADLRDKHGLTPLSFAAIAGNVEIVQLLLSRDDVEADSRNKEGRTPLSFAAKYGNAEIVKLLLERNDVKADLGDERGLTPLLFAAGAGKTEMIEWLLEGNDTKAESKNKESQIPFSFAAEHGNAEAVKLLLARDDVKADSKDEDGHTPLSYAAMTGSVEIAKLLLARDDVEADSRNKEGRTPLSFAAKYGHAGIVKLLLERDDVQADSRNEDGRTPLSLAAKHGKVEVVSLLLARDDVEADSRDKKGRTPLSFAAKHAKAEIVELLLSRDDVKADLKDDDGLTPLMFASRAGRAAIVEPGKR